MHRVCRALTDISFDDEVDIFLVGERRQREICILQGNVGCLKSEGYLDVECDTRDRGSLECL